MYIYVINLLAILSVSALLLLVGYHNAYSRWIAILLLVIGSINLTYSIQFTFIPILEQAHLLDPWFKELLVLLSIPGIYIHFYFLAGAFLVSSVYFADFIPEEVKKAASFCLIVPPLLIMSVRGDFTFPIEIHMVPLRFMAHFYTLLGCAIYTLAYVKEKVVHVRKKRLIYVLLLLFGIVSENLNYYTIQTIRIDWYIFDIIKSDFWSYNYINTTILLAGLVMISIKHGTWGIRLRMEQEKHDYSTRTLSAGTSILNHTIKNEIQKISYIHERSLSLLEQDRPKQAYELLQDIRSVTDHLMKMTTRIKEKAHDITLQPQWHTLSELLDAASAIPGLREKAVDIQKLYEIEGDLLCDGLHVRETINNLVMNALEAMPPEGGKLVLRTKRSGRKLVIDIQDNGTGIEKEVLERIFEPFFTTKPNSANYGLGLSYCYNVMQKHGGTIQVAESGAETGTTFSLTFPGHRFKEA
ncbi:sensor histidine kinase [Paenibacillus sedimenti]|uniref:histidine kinase n=1 Tax=Paenibacillus sedimenti TaxID=2770274 RepID=A0A926QHK9_9BACL|nr:HAMP domain-containing sensor histidine kinase [Paenibacillus sedimenti]MBD0379661.1 HAMP domain-containing histidine kinase [Paenibacillus sedimenti]